MYKPGCSAMTTLASTGWIKGYTLTSTPAAFEIVNNGRVAPVGVETLIDNGGVNCDIATDNNIITNQSDLQIVKIQTVNHVLQSEWSGCGGDINGIVESMKRKTIRSSNNLFVFQDLDSVHSDSGVTITMTIQSNRNSLDVVMVHSIVTTITSQRLLNRE